MVQIEDADAAMIKHFIEANWQRFLMWCADNNIYEEEKIEEEAVRMLKSLDPDKGANS